MYKKPVKYIRRSYMSQIFIPAEDAIVQEVLSAYDFPATLLGAVR